ncbi:MAG: hypothetical protein M3O90_06520 [Actinomycetota bacterium]|nr:hypothetical protein [Actinomycetota bacterium]
MLFAMTQGDNDELWTVDTATGQFTVVATLNGSPTGGVTVAAGAFGCDGTSLFAVLNDASSGGPSYLATVDTVDITTYCPGTITVRATAPFRSSGARKSATVRIRTRTLRSSVPRSSLRLRLRLDRPASLKRALRAGRVVRISAQVSFTPTVGRLQGARRNVTLR